MQHHEVPSLGGGGDQRVDEREGAVLASCSKGGLDLKRAPVICVGRGNGRERSSRSAIARFLGVPSGVAKLKATGAQRPTKPAAAIGANAAATGGFDNRPKTLVSAR